MKKTIQIPQFVFHGINHSKKGFNGPLKVFGCDHETVNGLVHTLQMKDENGLADLFYTDTAHVLVTFLDYIDKRLGRNEFAAAYFHNLNFDLPVLFSAEDKNFWMLSEFEVRRHGWTCKVNCEKRYFAKLSKDGRKFIQIIDSFSYLPMGLGRVAEVLNIPYKKLDKPEFLGEKPLCDPYFEDYAKADVDIEMPFGKWIVDLHEKYDVPLSVSFPQMCASIFKRHFLQEGDNIEFPPLSVIKPSVLSYHGGKNGMYVRPGLYKNCLEIDLNSAYAWAMRSLPSFLRGRYVKVDKFFPEYSGVYRISGKVHCPYNLIFSHNFKPIQGAFEHVWVTGHEIAAGLEYGELHITEITGHVWIPHPDSKRNPFADYVDYFYDLRNKTSKTDPMRTFYKYALNQLYGKTVQVTAVRDAGDAADATITESKDGKLIVKEKDQLFTAGGMFNPFIATQVTALCRVKLHMLEHKFKAIHSATDSIKTLEPVTGCSNELGGYKLEVHGKCILLRNKLYVHYDGDGPDAKVCKFALHGFTGKVKDLLELYESRTNKYTVGHIFKMREALRQKQTPLKMIQLSKKFGFDWNKFMNSPKVY